MPSLTDRYLIAIAASCGADIVLHEAELTQADVSRLDGLLKGLADLGHVASFTVERCRSVLDNAGLLSVLRQRWSFVVDALLRGDQTRHEPPPAYLVPVWPFDHEREGRPASTGRFLHLDLEVIASRTVEEERGVRLPGRTGYWLVRARPLLF